jgi:hypothetical protein
MPPYLKDERLRGRVSERHSGTLRRAASPKAGLQILSLYSSVMYNTGAFALPSVPWAAGFAFIFPPPSLAG